MTRRLWITWALATVFLATTRALEMRYNAEAVEGAFTAGDPATLTGLGAAAAIHAAIIVWLASSARLIDPPRLLAITAIGLGFVVVNNLEAVVFKLAPVGPLLALAALGAVVHAVTSIGVTRAVPPRQPGGARSASPLRAFSRRGLMTRIALLGVIYAVIYFAAGATIYPYVRDFYASKPLPLPGPLFTLQALVRGPLFVGVGALVVALLQSSRVTNALGVSCTLAGLGGLTALLAPNPLFPDAIRHVHLAEVGISNFVFGWIVGWTLSSSHRSATARSAPAVPITGPRGRP